MPEARGQVDTIQRIAAADIGQQTVSFYASF
jgi:hypothetical protein